mmetsp:Transcript_11649/g.21787  ORF Transcript_11649/g.21787 Transcript_11649/m.21787 type:complete len:111 (-) Transcript_11649:1407-1739(-)
MAWMVYTGNMSGTNQERRAQYLDHDDQSGPPRQEAFYELTVQRHGSRSSELAVQASTYVEVGRWIKEYASLEILFPPQFLFHEEVSFYFLSIPVLNVHRKGVCPLVPPIL